MATILSSDDLSRAATALRADQPVAMPTETVYGLAANALSPMAVASVFEAKQRPAYDPLIVHVSPALARGSHDDILGGLVSQGILAPLSADASAPAALLTTLWPGPLTLVLPRGTAIPSTVSSGLDTVAVRMPAHPVAQALIDAAGLPLVAPSANRFGRISPTTAQAVQTELGDRIGFIVDGGPCQVGVESTVLRVHEDGHTTLLRPGAVTAEQLADHLGVAPLAAGTPGAHPRGPGQLASHYAPRTPLELVDDLTEASWAPEEHVVALTWTRADSPASHTLTLAPDGDPATAARRLFACLRELDERGADRIIAERCPVSSGLGAAIRDRMQRASVR